MLVNDDLGGGNSNIFLFLHLFGEDEPNLTNIFQMGWNPPTSDKFLILPETNSKFAPEKMAGWKTICFLLGQKAYFQGLWC